MKKLLVLVYFAIFLMLITACSSNTTTTTDTTNDDTTTQTTTTSDEIKGEWKYSGTIDGKQYEVSLDLENNDRFSLDIDEESANETIDSEADGTYTYTDDTLTLSIITIQDANSYFDNTVVSNSQIEFNYELSNNNNSLTLKNVSSYITLLPDDLTLTRDY